MKNSLTTKSSQQYLFWITHQTWVHYPKENDHDHEMIEFIRRHLITSSTSLLPSISVAVLSLEKLGEKGHKLNIRQQ